MRQTIWHKMLLWRGDPVFITPAEREKLERVWTAAEAGEVIEVRGYSGQASNIAGFQESREELPSDLLPKPQTAGELPEPKAPSPLKPQFGSDVEWVKFKAPRQVQSYWKNKPEYLLLGDHVAYCRPAGHPLDDYLKRCTDQEIERMKKQVGQVQ